MSERQRGAIAFQLEPAALLEAGRAQLAIEHPDSRAELLTNGPLPQMLFAVNRGEIAIVNNEGVGRIADQQDNIEVTFTYGLQYLNLTLSLEAIAHATTEERIDLADGIRTFGSRLDGNHHRWFNRYDRSQ